MSAFRQAVICLLVSMPAVAHAQALETIVIKPALSADPCACRLGDLKAKGALCNASRF